MKTRLYLDTRKGREPYPLLLGISRGGATAYINIGVELTAEQWNAQARTLADLPPRRWPARDSVRVYVDRKRTEIQTALLRLESAGELHGLTAQQIKTRLLRELNPDTGGPVRFMQYFQRVTDRHHGRTREIYAATYKRIAEAVPDAARLTFEDITPAWLGALDKQLQKRSPSVNARNIHYRNIRAVINAAIDDGITTVYAFRKYKLKNEETEKRALTLDQLRRLLDAPTTARQAEFVDVFRIMLYLIGINATDLWNLTADNVKDGRLEYRRAKTGKWYSVRIEPAAAALLEQHKGRVKLVDVCEHYTSAHDLVKQMDKALKTIIPDYPYNRLSTYWARHTVASLMANDLDVPITTISAALGHVYGSRVTAVYINFDRRKVDAANARLVSLIAGR